jgi:hypothetical protein
MAAPAAPRFSRCPKCGHRPLPQDQSLPAACPGCGVILAKVGRARPVAGSMRGPRAAGRPGARSRLLLLAVVTLWGLRLIALDHREGEFGASFLHGPLLLFHEAGHVLFRPFGVHRLGALTPLLALAWAPWLLVLQRRHFGGGVLRED